MFARGRDIIRQVIAGPVGDFTLRGAVGASSFDPYPDDPGNIETMRVLLSRQIALARSRASMLA
jgi:hypothetical protein